MKIVDKVEIKNRGTIVIVTEIGPTKIYINDYLKQDNQQWQIVGIEMIHKRELFPDDPIGLLVRAVNGSHHAPELGPVEHVSNTNKSRE